MTAADVAECFTRQELRTALDRVPDAIPLAVYLCGLGPSDESRDVQFASPAEMASRIDVPPSKADEALLAGVDFHVSGEGGTIGGLWTAEWCDEPGRRYVRVRVPPWLHGVMAAL